MLGGSLNISLILIYYSYKPFDFNKFFNINFNKKKTWTKVDYLIKNILEKIHFIEVGEASNLFFVIQYVNYCYLGKIEYSPFNSL